MPITGWTAAKSVMSRARVAALLSGGPIFGDLSSRTAQPPPLEKKERKNSADSSTSSHASGTSLAPLPPAQRNLGRRGSVQSVAGVPEDVLARQEKVGGTFQRTKTIKQNNLVAVSGEKAGLRKQVEAGDGNYVSITNLKVKRPSGPQRPLNGVALAEEIEKANRRAHKTTKGLSQFMTNATLVFIYIWRHPYMRLIAPVYILLTDLLVHASDPTCHSEIDYFFPYIGGAVNLLNPDFYFKFSDWSWEAYCAKMLLATFCVLAGVYSARIVSRCCTKMTFFKAGKGAHFVPVGLMFLFLIIGANVWNRVLGVYEVPRPFLGRIHEPRGDHEYITDELTTWRRSANWIDTNVFLLDFFALFGVIDIILQDASQYQDSTKFRFRRHTVDLRKLWTRTWGGKFRLLVTYILFIISLAFVLDYVWSWSRIYQIKPENEQDESTVARWSEWAERSEVSNAAIYATQFLFDIIIVLQDWEFPTFENQLRVAVLGTNIAFEGRFVNYLAMVITACVDIKCMFFMVFFRPGKVGQYVQKAHPNNTNITETPTRYLWVVTNRTELSELETNHTFDFEARLAKGCFEPYDAAWQQKMIDERGGTGCKQAVVAQSKGKTEAVIDTRTGLYMAGGVNRCCDVRYRTSYTGVWDIGGTTVDDIAVTQLLTDTAIVATPIVIAFFLIFNIRRAVARSSQDMCRRVVLAQTLSRQFKSDHIAMPERNMDAGFQLNQDFITTREQALEHMLEIQGEQRAPTLWPNESDIEPYEVEFANELVEDDDVTDKLVKLQRPPGKNTSLVLVCGKGVYGVSAKSNATVNNLMKEVEKLDLMEGIDIENIRLRFSTDPWGKLHGNQLVGSLLPRDADDQVNCIYLHGKLALKPEEEEDATQWVEKLGVSLAGKATESFYFIRQKTRQLGSVAVNNIQSFTRRGSVENISPPDDESEAPGEQRQQQREPLARAPSRKSVQPTMPTLQESSSSLGTEQTPPKQGP